MIAGTAAVEPLTAAVCPVCEGRGLVAATPGQPGDGYERCEDCDV